MSSVPEPDGPVNSSAGAEFIQGFTDVLPMLLAVGPFGAVAGLAATASGLSLGEAVMLSSLVNAGSSQLAALQLVSQGTPVVIILATTFFINLRFLMYSLAIAPTFSGVPKHWRMIMAHMLVDQTFAFMVRRNEEHPEKPYRVAYFLGLGVPLLLIWIIGTVVGALFGTAVPQSWSIDFTIPLIFIALLVPAVKDRAAASAAIVAGVVAYAASPLPLNFGLMIAAVVGIAAGLLGEKVFRM